MEAKVMTGRKKTTVFEYESFVFLKMKSTKIRVDSDGVLTLERIPGALSEEDFNKEFGKPLFGAKTVITNPQLVQDIEAVYKTYKNELSQLPKELFYPCMLDGTSYVIRFGKKKIEGNNIFEDVSVLSDNDEYLGTKIKPALQSFQKIFQEVRQIIDSYVPGKSLWEEWED